MDQVDVKDASVNIILEIDGKLCVAAFEREKFEAISFIVKKGLDHLVKTDKTQEELIDFIGIGG